MHRDTWGLKSSADTCLFRGLKNAVRDASCSGRHIFHLDHIVNVAYQIRLKYTSEGVSQNIERICSKVP